MTGSLGASPLEGVDVVLADLDGVVYAGHRAIPHAVDALTEAAASGRRVGYLTNNASRTPQTVAAQLRELGLATEPDDIVSSPQAAVVLLAGLVPARATVLVVGGDGLVSELERAGFRVTRSADDAPAAVVQGFAPEVAWTDLAEAAFALKGGDAGIPWVATNTDWTIPQARGTAPGNGTLVSAVHTAVGRLPVVAGKPERALFDVAVERFGAQHPLFIGDRLDTDILGARRAGMPSALVLTGIDGPKQLLAAAADSRPDFVLEDLRGLSTPYPRVEDVRDIAGVRRVRVGAAMVRHQGSALTLETPGSDIDRIRAAAAAVWGAGVPIYALEVAPELYSWRERGE
ncbi:MAG: haloacid dehalogenase [Leifsonia xyli]|nr:MAG: haloacid dehalogenase [Leifsonia xyli]